MEACLRDHVTVALPEQSVLISRHGKEYGIEDSAAPIRADDGSTLGAVLVFHDVTEQLNGSLRSAAEEAARTLGIPVVGLDFLVPSAEQPKYAIVEANERPGLANHEPAPTAERFVDLLFPHTAA